MFWRQVAFQYRLDQEASFLMISDENRLSMPIEIEKILSNIGSKVSENHRPAKQMIYCHGTTEKQKTGQLSQSISSYVLVSFRKRNSPDYSGTP